MLHTISYALTSNTRQGIRKELVELFLNEIAGNGTGDNASKYIYVVENLEKYGVYLQRPTRNYGFDFVVNVDTLYFKIIKGRGYTNPTYDNIISILTAYKTQYGNIYPTIQSLIWQIYNCQNIDINHLSCNLPTFTNYDGEQIPIALILYCIKWLFIEQDITYWNYSGRNMLFSHLQNNGLV